MRIQFGLKLTLLISLIALLDGTLLLLLLDPYYSTWAFPQPARLRIDISDPHFLTGLTHHHRLIWFSTSSLTRRPSPIHHMKLGEAERKRRGEREQRRQQDTFDNKTAN